MKKLSLVLCVFIFVCILPAVSSPFEVYRMVDTLPTGIIPYHPNYINGLVYPQCFATTYIPISQPYPPTGIIEYWVFQWNMMNSYNHVQTFTEMDRSDWAIFQPGAYQTFYDPEIKLPR